MQPDHNLIDHTATNSDDMHPDSSQGKVFSKADKAGKGSKPLLVRPREIGGPSGPEPTRYGDWEKNGRCSDF